MPPYLVRTAIIIHPQGELLRGIQLYFCDHHYDTEILQFYGIDVPSQIINNNYWTASEQSRLVRRSNTYSTFTPSQQK